MRKDPGAGLSEAQPLQSLPEVLVVFAPVGGHDEQGPLAVPGGRPLAVDALGGLSKALLTTGSQPVLAAASVPTRHQPIILRESRNRSTNQALRKPKRGRELDQAAQGYDTAPGCN